MQQQPIFHQLTAGQIRQLQQDAIAGYDVVRKKRKEIKYKQQQQQQYYQQVAPQQQAPEDPWGVCFQ